MSSVVENFRSWLTEKLNELQLDETVYLDYVIAILEGDEPSCEKFDILTSVLQSAVGEIPRHVKEIIVAWNLYYEHKREVEAAARKSTESISQQFARFALQNVHCAEQPTTSVQSSPSVSEEEAKIRQLVLSQYSHADKLDEEDEGENKSSVRMLEKNTNCLVVEQAEKERRIKCKAEHEKKKEKDKADREKQKTTSVEKKEAKRKRAQRQEHRKY